VGLFNPLANVGLADLLKRVHGEEIEFGSVSPELMIAHVVRNDRLEDMASEMGQATPWGVRLVIGATAAVFSGLSVQNPVGTNVIAVVTSWACDAASPSVDLNVANGTGLISSSPVQPTDSRLQSKNTPLFAIGKQLGAVPAGGIIWDRHISNTEHLDNRGWAVLAPGSAFEVWNAVVNAAIIVNVRGYLRRARPEELLGEL
jgi:hypothetical protein